LWRRGLNAMRWLIWSILLFAAAVAVALLARVSVGNVAIFWPPYRVDASLNLVALSLVGGFVVFHLFLLGIRRALELPGRVREYRERRRVQLATEALRDALLALFEGRFGRAERRAQAAQEVPELAGTAALLAASAAHRLGERERRDGWLTRLPSDERAQTAFLTLQAEFAVADRQTERALEAVNRLQAGGARHLHAQRIALRAQELAGNWREVLRTLRALDKRDALPAPASLRLRRAAYEALFEVAGDDLVMIKRVWAEIPERDRGLSAVADCAATAFARAGDGAMAGRILEDALETAWSNRLAGHYARLEALAPRDRLTRAEQWLKRRPDEARLLQLLGELCLQEKLWGKARDYLGQALAREPESAAIHRALALLHEALDTPALAAEHWRASAQAFARQTQEASAARVRTVGLEPPAAALGEFTGFPQ